MEYLLFISHSNRHNTTTFVFNKLCAHMALIVEGAKP